MDESIEEMIMFELKNFNFKRNSLGYEYLIDAIKMVVKNKGVIRDFTEYVYKPVAEKYDTGAKNVLWCICKLLNLMYFNTEEKIIDEYFNTYMHDKPTAKAFIIGVERKVRIEKESSILISKW